jgi:hypothetical protein
MAKLLNVFCFIVCTTNCQVIADIDQGIPIDSCDTDAGGAGAVIDEFTGDAGDCATCDAGTCRSPR